MKENATRRGGAPKTISGDLGSAGGDMSSFMNGWVNVDGFASPPPPTLLDSPSRGQSPPKEAEAGTRAVGTMAKPAHQPMDWTAL